MTEFHWVENQSQQIYLDHNATTPLAREISELVPQWLKEWGNPSSIHQSGRGPKALIRSARRSLAQAWDCHPLEIVFTSGGSEANNLVLKGTFQKLNSISNRQRKPRFICSAVEHPSVLKTLEVLRAQGAEVVSIPVNRQGFLDLEIYEKALIEKPTDLVSIMYANNETGNKFPLVQLIELAHSHGALIHSDMVQALGKENFSLRGLNLDFASFSAHKFYSLKGAGALYCKKGHVLPSLIHGGAQERSRRAGTENALSIAAFGKMAEMHSQVEEQRLRIEKMRDNLQEQLIQNIADVEITGLEAPRLSNTLSALISDVDGETLLMNLDMAGFGVSTGAACSSGNPEPSPVLLAMGLTRFEAQSSLRIGLGWGNTQEDIDQFLKQLVATVERLRSFKDNSSSESELSS